MTISLVLKIQNENTVYVDLNTKRLLRKDGTNIFKSPHSMSKLILYHPEDRALYHGLKFREGRFGCLVYFSFKSLTFDPTTVI